VAESNSSSLISEKSEIFAIYNRLYRWLPDSCTLSRCSHTTVHCQADIARSVSRRESRPTDRHTDEVTADATGRPPETLRSKGQSVCCNSCLEINSRALSTWQCTLPYECLETVHQPIQRANLSATTPCPKKRPPFIFLNNSVKK